MKPTTWSSGLSVTADGSGVVAHAGSVAVRLLADRTGLTAELSKALTRASFVPVHGQGIAMLLRERNPAEGTHLSESGSLVGECRRSGAERRRELDAGVFQQEPNQREVVDGVAAEELELPPDR